MRALPGEARWDDLVAASVLECGGSLPQSGRDRQSGKGLPHSKTLRGARTILPPTTLNLTLETQR